MLEIKMMIKMKFSNNTNLDNFKQIFLIMLSALNIYRDLNLFVSLLEFKFDSSN